MEGPTPGPIVKLGSGPKIQISTNIDPRIANTSSVCIKTKIRKNDALSQLIELTNRAFPNPGLPQGDTPSPGPQLARAHTATHQAVSN